ncbi:MAG TPA: NUDIX hydrolase [Streptosporangiaceae bacterium]|nr:NUDIX hydrolase [Streptosporangiaceae bacterium]
MPEPTFTGPDVWYAGLAGVVVAAGALITDRAGRVLLVKPNYRELWSIPGGICEFGEPPHSGCAREVAEELGLDIPVGRLLAADWSQPFGADERPIMHFLFDGGSLEDGGQIVLQEAELDGFRFTEPGELSQYLPPHGQSRVGGALRARESGAAVFVPHDIS